MIDSFDLKCVRTDKSGTVAICPYCHETPCKTRMIESFSSGFNSQVSGNQPTNIYTSFKFCCSCNKPIVCFYEVNAENKLVIKEN